MTPNIDGIINLFDILLQTKEAEEEVAVYIQSDKTK